MHSPELDIRTELVIIGSWMWGSYTPHALNQKIYPPITSIGVNKSIGKENEECVDYIGTHTWTLFYSHSVEGIERSTY